MTKEHPTLLDSLVIELNNPAYRRLPWDVRALQKTLLSARRFVLDDEMSAFSTDLAYAPLVSHDVEDPSKWEGNYAVVDEMRRLARLPHSLMWIELNMKRRVERAREYGVEHSLDGPGKIGWLLMQHPQVETAFMALECVSDTVKHHVLQPIATAALVGYQWRTDDEGPLMWSKDLGYRNFPENPEGVLTGFLEFRSPFAGVCNSPFMKAERLSDIVTEATALEFFYELASDLRYLWALLAAINDVPVGYEAVRPSRGYVSRGVYRKYLEHTVIHLKVPHAVPLRVLAKRAIHVARRRAHQVRGHWRRNHRKPGERMWVKEHQRGDAKLGFVTHDYQVEHGREA